VGAFLESVGVELPIVQAGMGGGLAQHELAAAVSGAGGLGTIGILDPQPLRQEIAKARERLKAQPVAVNLLLPFARQAHFDAASEADVVVTFWGRPERRTSKPWIHQCGSVAEAQAAHRAGAEAVIAQGVEAGGHVRGHMPALELLKTIRIALPDGYPVLSAGGIADASDVKTRLDAGAEAVVCGTRFLMSEESGAHPEYKSRLTRAHETMVTEMFGFGWPAAHRVIPNQATDRWLRTDPRGPGWLRAINRLAVPIVATGPASSQFRMVGRMAALQRPSFPLFSPAGAVVDGPSNLIEAGPLYAGESVARIADIRPAGALVRELAAEPSGQPN
jgi:NAD(P)H-dependent flavin oxidoreductase YrpB (nitropropane dioxygenase family)